MNFIEHIQQILLFCIDFDPLHLKDEKLTIKFLEEDIDHRNKEHIGKSMKENLHVTEKRESVKMIVNFSHKNSVVVKGNSIGRIMVGSVKEFLSQSQNPPKKDDCFLNKYQLKNGHYKLSVIGGVNPYHGIITFLCTEQDIDDLQLSELKEYEIGQMDFQAAQTDNRITKTLQFELFKTGQINLYGLLKTKNVKALDYWACLDEIKVEKIL